MVFHLPNVFVVLLRGEISSVRLIVGKLHEDEDAYVGIVCFKSLS